MGSAQWHIIDENTIIQFTYTKTRNEEDKTRWYNSQDTRLHIYNSLTIHTSNTQFNEKQRHTSLTHIQDTRLVLKSFIKTEVSNKYKNICRSQHRSGRPYVRSQLLTIHGHNSVSSCPLFILNALQLYNYRGKYMFNCMLSHGMKHLRSCAIRVIHLSTINPVWT